MSSFTASELESLLSCHYAVTVPHGNVRMQEHRFARNGFLLLRDVVPDSIRGAVREEVLKLLDQHAERRDLRLATTDNTPRRMSVVPSELVAEHGELIRSLYRSPTLRGVLEQVTGEPLLDCPSKDEEFLITRQERMGDTHGWHWGDFSFALIWIVETPPVACGGMLQCVPHTRWDKSDAQIHEHLCANSIATYGFRTGDIYLLRTDTTLHRTVPLNQDTTRIILNMTWAGQRDISKRLAWDDRWWDDAKVSAANADQNRVPNHESQVAVGGC
jgi:L-lysine 4-chlorinase